MTTPNETAKESGPTKSTISVKPDVRRLAKHMSFVLEKPIGEVVQIALQRLKDERQIKDPPDSIGDPEAAH